MNSEKNMPRPKKEAAPFRTEHDSHGPAARISDLAAEDYIIFHGECYRVMRTQAVYVGGEVSHHEAVLVKEERG